MVPSAVCPLCSGERLAPRAIEVCGACAGSVAATGGVQMSSTAEFAAVTSVQADALLEAGPPPPRAAAPSARCTWCGKPRQEVKQLLSGGGAHICNECVALCSDILLAELGDTWR